MQLTVWTYEGPPHVGAMRVATGMEDVHYVLHSPQGDTYADLLFTMIERRDHRPPVTYTTFKSRDLGSDTATLFKDACEAAYERFKPQTLLVGSSCTAELIQDDPGGLTRALNLPIPVVNLELPAYQRKENWGASETFYQVVRKLAGVHAPNPGEDPPKRPEGAKPSCNILGPTALGFRHRDDVEEITRLLNKLGIEVNVTAPMGADPSDVERLYDADFNVVLYPEVAHQAAQWLKRTFRQPMVTTTPIGIQATEAFVKEVAEVAGVDPSKVLKGSPSRMPWWSRSVDSNYLTGKRVFIFGDGTHAAAAARVAKEELGFEVVGVGTYTREFAREVRAVAKEYGCEALITDDYLEVESKIEELLPELILGTQMERHVAKRHGIACAVISAPVHVEDFPARYSPQMGFEGANVIFDTWVHPLMMGLEEHLLGMFREDFEFHDAAGGSHYGASESAPGETDAEPVPVVNGNGAHGDAGEAEPEPEPEAAANGHAKGDGQANGNGHANGNGAEAAETFAWDAEASKELKKIPFFVRGKVRRNTERFAAERGIETITLGTLYDAKAHFSS